jgi:WD40 repeat protein
VNPTGGFVDSIAINRDISRVATGERGGPIRVWSVGSDAEPITLGERRQAVIDVAFSPDGATLASLGRHGDGALSLWQPGFRGGPNAEIAAVPVGRCLALRFDGSGTRLGVMCETEVIVLDVASRHVIARVSTPHPQHLTAFDLSADGAKILTAGHEGDVAVWDAATATATRRFSVSRSRRPGPLPRGLEPPEVWAVVVALSPDGTRAAAVTIEGTVYAWDVATGAELISDAHPEASGPPNGSLRFGADGTLLAPMGDRRGMRVFDLSRKKSRVVASGLGAYHAVGISDDASGFAAITSALGSKKLVYSVEIWRVR